MSGGSHDYVYLRIQENLCGQMEDPVLDEMMNDIRDLAYALEWWKSADSDERSYRRKVSAFKRKWFVEGGCNVAMRGVIQERIKEDQDFMLRILEASKRHDETKKETEK